MLRPDSCGLYGAGHSCPPHTEHAQSLHRFNPSNFSPSGVSLAGEQFFFSHSRGSPGKADPRGGSISLQERIRISRRSSRDSSAGVMEVYWAMRTLSFEVLGRMPWASRLLKISRSPALGMTGTISKPVVSGFQGSRLAG